MSKKILYLHGFASSGASGTVDILRKMTLTVSSAMDCLATKIRLAFRGATRSSNTIRECLECFTVGIG